MHVSGAQVLHGHGIYADGWCEAAGSLSLSAEYAASAVQFSIWLPAAPGSPQRVRFAAQIDLLEPLVFDVTPGDVIRVHLACERDAGRPAILSLLCDRDVAERGDDVRRISFRFDDAALTPQDAAAAPSARPPAQAGSGLAVRALDGSGLYGDGAQAGSLVTVTAGGEVCSTRSDAAGVFRVALADATYDGSVRAVRVACEGVEPLMLQVVADPALRTSPPAGDACEGAMLLPPAAQSPEAGFVLARMRRPSRAVLDRLARRAASLFGTRTLSIVMPIFDTPLEWLRTSVGSVLAQWCPNWQLVCIDDCSTDAAVGATLREFAAADSRIVVLSTPRRSGPAAAINLGLRAAHGEFVAFLDHDDFLEADAVWKFLAAAAGPDVDLIYSDELLTTDDIDTPRNFVARPAFSHDYYLDHPYFVHFVACRRSVALATGGYDETMSISADVDFILRVLERARAVAHVPEVLYRWRTQAASLGHERKDEVMQATLGTLDRHVKLIDPQATARHGLGFNQYRIDWPDRGGRVLIVIPTKNRGDLLEKAIASIEVTSRPEDYRIVVIDHASDEPATQAYLRSIEFRHTVVAMDGEFNFSALNNAAVRTYGADCPFVLFMNNDVEAAQPHWLSRLRSLAGRIDVGAVCPLLLYPGDEPGMYGRVQHGGVLVGFEGAADHAFKGVPAYEADGSRHGGYNSSLNVVREFSAVTGACLMLRRDVFDAVDGFDETLRVGFNDTDLCLRIGARGWKVLYDGHTLLYHHESATRRPANLLVHETDSALFVRRWAHMIRDGDDFYSPLLAGRGTDHVAVRPRADARRRSPRVRRAALALAR